jgi:hypothetical protein
MRGGWRPAALNRTVAKISAAVNDFFATFGHKAAEPARHGVRTGFVCAERKSRRGRESES